MLLVELVVVVVAIPRSEQFLVGVAYYYGAAFTGQTQNVLVGVQLSCILQGFVVALESADNHSFQSLHLFCRNLKISYEEVREVVFCQLIQQLVLIDRVRLVCYDK